MEREQLDFEVWADRDGCPVPFGDARGVSVLHGTGAWLPADKVAELRAICSPPADRAIDQPAAIKAVRAPKARK